VRVSSRALERLRSPTSWGIVHSDTLRRLQRVRGSIRELQLPWQLAKRPDESQNLAREADHAERILVTGWRKRMRVQAELMFKLCEKRPMPVDAVAFGATVPATHFYEIPYDCIHDVGSDSVSTSSNYLGKG